MDLRWKKRGRQITAMLRQPEEEEEQQPLV